MAVRDGVIAWLGSDAVGRERFPGAEVFDLDGHFVAPGFVDSHVHVTETGLTRIGLDLRPATSRRHCLTLIADYVAAHPDGPVWGHGWDESGWPDGPAPTTAELDAVVGERPVYLSRIDVHSALASTALRRQADAAETDPARPLAGDPHHRVRAVARGLLTAGQRAAARTSALDAAAAAGIVAVHECAGPDIGGLDDWLELRELARQRPGVEVVGYWGQPVTAAAEATDLMARTGARGLAGDLFVDGALGSHTAWLHEPYADAPGCTGECHLDGDAVRAHLWACTEAGVTAGFHVIGDAAVSTVVAALEQVVEHFGIAAVARCGHRLEHLEMVSPEQATRLGSFGVIASMQPSFDALWGGPDGMYAERLGVERAAGLNPLALLASEGVPLAFGSDTPVTSLDPWLTVRAAARHRTPGSAISMRAAFAASTRAGWRAAGVDDGISGTLVPGAPASYAVWEVGRLAVGAPRDAVQRWSTDPRSRVPALPVLEPGDALPRCVRTVHRGAVLYG
ncbi:amidohydrolase [Mycolicibacter acidiphilus]